MYMKWVGGCRNAVGAGMWWVQDSEKYSSQVRYKFGIHVPRTYEEETTLDKENGNNLWGDATRCELDQIFSYKSFRDLGSGGSPGEGYKKIKVCNLISL